jgi:ubiquinone/menaquinone biosynthesis C-methylase UbiE
LLAAQRLPQGEAIGVDIWSSTDQSGNAMAATLANAAAEGVTRQVQLHTADMRDLPFAANDFDLVVSNLGHPQHRRRSRTRSGHRTRPGACCARADG